MRHPRQDILDLIKSAFPDDDEAKIAAFLDRYGIEPHERERERVQLAIIELSGGDREKLVRLVAEAKRD